MKQLWARLIGTPGMILRGFKDPRRRPRMIIWAGWWLVTIVALMVPTLAVTSTRWFCANGCHKVQDDTITAYEHSAHRNVSCLACHLPVDTDAVVFLSHKMTAVGELLQAVTNTYELPLNGHNEVSLEMPMEQCTQCHDVIKYKPTPAQGFRIDHKIHISRHVACPTCHNRVAHKEDFQLLLTDPRTGESNRKHEDFMEMTACFRCHSQDPLKDGPRGQCSLCHTAEFHLRPVSHQDAEFLPQGHARLASAEETRVPWLTAADTTESASTHSSAATQSESSGESTGSTPHGERFELPEGPELKKVTEINTCSTCHSRAFCTGCHGVRMPHTGSFKQAHGTEGRAKPQVCEKCHRTDTDFCGACHHGTRLKYKIDPRRTWRQQHPLAVHKVGPASCVRMSGCHSPAFCAKCHANGGTQPPGAARL